MPVSSSGVLGSAGRYALPTRTGPRASDLRLAGSPLPMTGTLRVYTCGITPYDVTHLGHAATFVWSDLLTTLAHASEVKTVSCRNVTDIDDVLTLAAGERHRYYDELAVTQEFLFERDMADLSVARPDLTPHARGHVPQVVQLADALLARGAAYQRNGTVYFSAPEDLALGGLSRDEALAALREFGDAGEDDRDSPFDVPVWKPSTEDHPAWPSPWGWGRPAWHIECSAMAATVFGYSVDVLVGGADLMFPHHAYQAAMVEAASGTTPFARRTMHVGTVGVDGAKMAKSTGNLVLVRDLLSEYSGAVLRMLLLNRRWQDPWQYDVRQLAVAAEQVEALHSAAGRTSGEGQHEVLAALLDDLDVPTAYDRALKHGGVAARTLADLLKL